VAAADAARFTNQPSRKQERKSMRDIAQTSADDTPQPHPAIRRISHELRTPLTVVIGFCELLQDEQPDDEHVREFASRISANAWVLHAAVERLIKELHSADYTGPPTSDQIQFDPGTDWAGTHALVPHGSRPTTSPADQLGNLVVTDQAQVAE
jgi:hypothetical protein